MLNGHRRCRLACYDGKVGARAMESLRPFMDRDAAFDGNAYTITSTYGGIAGGCLLLLRSSIPRLAGRVARK